MRGDRLGIGNGRGILIAVETARNRLRQACPELLWPKPPTSRAVDQIPRGDRS